MEHMTVTKSPGYLATVDSSASFNPTDATTYYTGALFSTGAGTTSAERRFYIPKGGTIRAAYIFFLTAGTLGSNETSTISIRVNDTTDYTISSSITVDARVKTFNNTALSIPVQAGDYIEIKWVTPTWVTNPTTVRFSVNLFIGT